MNALLRDLQHRVRPGERFSAAFVYGADVGGRGLLRITGASVDQVGGERPDLLTESLAVLVSDVYAEPQRAFVLCAGTDGWTPYEGPFLRWAKRRMTESWWTEISGRPRFARTALESK